MAALSLEKVHEILKTDDIPGSEKEIRVLCIRMGELLELNGEQWVRENRSLLLEQWQWVVKLKTIR
jgi:hypothetical protein